MRTSFDEQLALLNRRLIEMGALCEDAISASMRALAEEPKAAEKTKNIEREIDHAEREIEALCMKLLLQQQPVARDLRAISSALKMISDMERIGDQASDIAEIMRYINNDDIMSATHLAQMAKAASRMVTSSVDSFVRRDLGLARQVQEDDDTVDALFDTVKQELVAGIRQEPSRGSECLDILMIAKYLERIGDHAVNVAEWVEYSITGVHAKE
ncbi:MAG: phosphate signaling complex protein PhoU [Faecousia sp.]